MKLLVTGCARSGTTLMIHLTQYFYNCKVLIENEQHPFDYLEYNSKDHILVIKKPMLEKHNLQYFNLRQLLDMGWFIIWMIRDGRDVIVSKHGNDLNYVDSDRWVKTNYEMLKVCDDHGIITVRYEDLCNNPDNEMKRISNFINQDYQKDFVNFYEQMADTPMNAGINPRPIDTDSIGSHLKHPQEYYDFKFLKLLNIFGYGM
jgi:hypothetical protein